MNTAMTVLYGASPPFDPDPYSPWWPKDLQPPQPRWDWDVTITMSPCPTCLSHVRIGEPCPFCMKRKIEEIEKRLDEQIAQAPAKRKLKRRKRRR